MGYGRSIIPWTGIRCAATTASSARNALLPPPRGGGNEGFERFRRITGYVETLDRYNDAKRAEERTGWKHHID